MSKVLHFILGVAAYLVFLGVFVYLVGFVGDLVVPLTIDRGPESSVVVAAAIDVALIALFGLQHSIMARPAAKRVIARFIPEVLERSLFVMASNAVLVVLFLGWRPITAVVWSVDAEWTRWLLWSVCALGWAIVFASTWLLDHFELFGLKQHWANVRGRPSAPTMFREPLFYKWVRHPLYVGFILAFWATPRMTAGHLLFAAGMTVYVLIAIRHEERDLVNAIGPAYRDYRRRVGMLIPGIGRSRD